MNTKIIRVIFLCIIFVMAMSLYSHWQQMFHSKNLSQQSAQTAHKKAFSTIPTFAVSAPKSNSHLNQINKAHHQNQIFKHLINIQSKVLDLKINPIGGNIISAKLLKYFKTLKDQTPLTLLTPSKNNFYTAQSGLTNIKNMNQIVFMPKQRSYKVDSNKSEKIILSANVPNQPKLEIIKVYTVQPNSYNIHLKTYLVNHSKQPWTGAFFGQLLRTPPNNTGGEMLFHIGSFTGAALSSPSDHYNKQSFSDIQSEPVKVTARSGWAAMIQHYFVGAWIPQSHTLNTFYTRYYGHNIYGSGLVSESKTIQPGQTAFFNSSMYIGPAIAKNLNQAAPHLSLTIDYGFFWFLSDPIFAIMKWLFHFLGNWGVSIILVTLLIKLVFWPLSSKGYRSMGRMKLLQPKLKLLKERYGDDKQKMQKATMELYRKEKVNPLGGCFPQLIQIPFFFALYWVIIESVEFRHAHFLWIHDLSIKDPFFILPILTGVSMWLMQKLNPSPPDKTQAKIMMALPIIFTVVFAQFPAGLVLYWLSNNVFSMIQQWWVMRKLAAIKS